MDLPLFIPIISMQNVCQSFCFRPPSSASDSAWICSRFFELAETGFSTPRPALSFAMLLGWGLGKTLNVQNRISFLVSTGTAICGGSAVAAVAPMTNASEEEIAVSLGTVFFAEFSCIAGIPCNRVRASLDANTVRPVVRACAIHDTSSVVGATAKFGAVALAVGTTVKLARLLWIVPMSIGTSVVNKSKARIHWPWFILFFCLAAVANTYLHTFQTIYPSLKHLGVVGLPLPCF